MTRTRRTVLAALLAAALLPVLASASPQAAAAPAKLEKPKDVTAWLVGHAHIDLGWLWRWEETVHDIAVQTFQGTLAQMAKMPGLTFAQSQPAVYEAVEKNYPDLFRAIRDKVRQGTWVPVGGMWAEPDVNMPDGEALARQLLYGKRYFLDKFGFDVTVGWNPDTFGHSWQMPQILNKAGIRSYVFGRCAPENTPLFRWEGKDGSSVLCAVPPGWYNVSLENGVAGILAPIVRTTPARDFMILYGAGDHGGGPRDPDLAAIRRFRKDKAEPKLEFGTPPAYFRWLETANLDLPLVKRELNFTFPACYTTQVETKKNNRRTEGLLVAAEKFSALAATSGYRDYYPERDIDEAWKIALRNQFHDILDGSGIGPLYEESAASYREAQERGRRALDFSLQSIVNKIDTRGDGTPLVVFNSLAWDRTDVVEADVERPAGSPGAIPRLRDADGAEVPVQPVFAVGTAPGMRGRDRVRLVFLAKDVPSLGYKTYRLSWGDAPAPATPALTASATQLENEFLKVAIDPKTGWVSTILDKRTGKETLAGPGNAFQAIADESKTMSAWELDLKGSLGTVGEGGAEVELAESGPVRAVVRATAPFRSSSFANEIILYAGLPRVDFRSTYDWQERNVMIKAAFPLAVATGQAEFEIPYGSITRPADGTEVPALRWIDVSTAADGGATLLNDCKYGFDVKGGVARMSIVHGATEPDPEADRGRHEVRYALLPHAGTWKDAEAIRRGYDFNNALIARAAMVHPGVLPARQSLLTAGPSNVVASALKKETGYYNRALILHLYETQGTPSEAAVTFPWPVRFQEVDFVERTAPGVAPADAPGDGRTIKLTMKPYEIKAVRVERRPGS